MKINHITDYQAQTAAHYTTCSLPEELQRLVDRNRSTLADIAATAGNTIAHQAREYARNHLLGGTSVDIMV